MAFLFARSHYLSKLAVAKENRTKKYLCGLLSPLPIVKMSTPEEFMLTKSEQIVPKRDFYV